MIAGHSLPNCSNFQTNPGHIKLFYHEIGSSHEGFISNHIIYSME